ncbi:GntR family transcriptional regulator [Periweissella cryptocerci]|uniref:GntR family transcriptional regulator n=1 Tax=Periweissella cryptocerci TaxID=2506420 RepID=A0A4P6YSV9_9LACO|nr:GntR family transcriptional regulator [Periweissella cryptocerci]QBO35814.1 GntR family transcriptional regulator [Periweissella cryptocerci]
MANAEPFYCTKIKEAVFTQGDRALKSVIYDTLARLIRSGEIEPGTELKQPEIANFVGISREPVRQALAALAKQGLIGNDCGRYWRVIYFTKQHLAEFRELTTFFDTLAGRQAIVHYTDAELQYLVNLWKPDQISVPDEQGAMLLLRRFDGYLYKYMTSLFKGHYQRLMRQYRESLYLHELANLERRPQLLHEKYQIALALQTRDEGQIQTAITKHYTAMADFVLEHRHLL